MKPESEPEDSIDITYTDNKSESDGDTSYKTESDCWKIFLKFI